MSVWGMPSQQHEPTADAVTISRVLSGDESLKRLKVARRAVLIPLVSILFPALWLVAVVLVGALTRSAGLTIGFAVMLAVLLGGGTALGLTVGNETLRRQARYELGESGLLTVVWDERGGRIAAENLQRTFTYSDVIWMRDLKGFVVLKFPMPIHPSPHVFALPPDFVPDEVRQRFVAAGVRIR